MNILYDKLPNGSNMNLLEKFLEVKEDLLDNKKDLLNRFEYFIHKYRGNRLNDINVGIWEDSRNKFSLQMFLQNKEGYVKNIVTFDRSFRLLNDELKVVLNA